MFRLNEDQRQMVVDNSKLVGWFLARYCRGWNKIRPNEVQDLKQELYMGLCRAAHEFKPDKGSFATYAMWWMRSRMTEWARKLPPLQLKTIPKNARELIDMNFNPEMERWRALLGNLTNREKDFLNCTRPKAKKAKKLSVGREQYIRRQNEIILYLRRQHIG